MRSTIVAFIALSLAMLPVAGAQVRGFPSDGFRMSAHIDCCPHGQPCAMQEMAHYAKSDHAKGQCGDHAACGGKCPCLGLTAVLSSPAGALPIPLPFMKTALMAESASSPAYIPPSPPPRV